MKHNGDESKMATKTKYTTDTNAPSSDADADADVGTIVFRKTGSILLLQNCY